MSSKPKVLLVDDEDAIRMSATFALEAWYEITAVGTTRKALELLEKDRFDLVLLDIIIRGEGEEAGITALKVINEKYPGLPVIMVSGSLTWIPQWEKLQQLGANGYLLKPYERDRFRDIIERCLNGEKIDKPL